MTQLAEKCITNHDVVATLFMLIGLMIVMAMGYIVGKFLES